MRRPCSAAPLLAVPLAAALLLMPAAAHGQAPSADAARTVTVAGEGTVRVVPDQATVRFGVETEGEDPEVVRQENAAAGRRALDAVRERGVPEAKIRLTALSLRPVRAYNRRTQKQEDRGYRAVRTLVVELTDLDLLPGIVAAVVQQGANRLDGVEYGLQDRDAVRNDALRAAAEAGRAKAALLAETLGATLGLVRTISEQRVEFPRPMMRMEMARAEGAARADAAPEPAAYAAGEIEVTASVQLTFTLGE